VLADFIDSSISFYCSRIFFTADVLLDFLYTITSKIRYYVSLNVIRV